MTRIPFFRFLRDLFIRAPRAEPVAQKTDPAPVLTADPAPDPAPGMRIAWGAKVTAKFKDKVIAISDRLKMEPDHLMAIMAFETGRSFDPAVTNHAGSGATGLIQFMPRTAEGLGTSTAALKRMSPVDQLDYVERYLKPYAGRIDDLQSAYMAVLYPRAISKPANHVLFRKGSVAYRLNRGLDRNGDGSITKAEAAGRVVALLAEGLRPGNIG